MLKFFVSFIFLFLSLLKLNAQSCPEIIGYFPNWQWYDRSHLLNPLSIQYSKYSIINYAFFKPELNGDISSTDAWADQNLLQGQINWSTSPLSYYPNTSIIDRAHNANTKVLPSIGGWTLSDHFPTIAASLTKRINFAHSCCNLIRTYNFDGIDIDWEYPGYVPNSGTPADKQNFTLFLQTIRDSLTALGLQQNKTYLLTACFGASKANMQQIEWNNVKNIVDMINLMSYDYFGSWDAIANHNAPLSKPLQGDPSFNIDSSVTYLINQYQVPTNKLAAGLAFYGRSAKTIGPPALFAPITGVDNITFSDDDGTPLYYNILKKQNLFTRLWDGNAQVPYLLGNAGLQTFVSYDDKESIALKANYIKNKNLGGAIIWEITGDYLETAPGSGIIGSTPLIDTLRTVFCNNIVTNSPPSVSITSPVNNTSDSIGSMTSVQVLASDVDGSITLIELFMNNTLISSSSIASLNFNITNSMAGNYTLYAKAYDNTGAMSISNSVVLTINSNPSTTTCNYPVWNAGTVYLANDTVIYNNIIYQAKYWTSNNNPATNYGNCCAWNYIMPCGGFTAATCFKPNYDPLIAYTANQEVYWNGNIYKAQWWTLNESPATNSGSGGVWLLLPAACNSLLHIKAMIEGYYSGYQTMRSVLSNQGLSSATNLTDSVAIELHGASAPYALVSSYKGIMNISGNISCSFTGLELGNYYIVIRYRNTVETWSAEPITISGITNYDFTTAANKAYGSNQTEVEPGVWALFSGDINQDENIDLGDFSLLELDINNFEFGYKTTDINGDGSVDLQDVPLVELNSGLFIFSNHP